MRYLIKESEVYAIVNSNKKPKNYVADWPINISPSDLKYCSISEVVDESSGETIWTVALDEGVKAQTLSQTNIINQVSSENSKMKSSVKQEMVKAFGTSDESSANAFFTTWQEWFKDPGSYSNKGYVSHMEVKDELDNVLFYVGEPLNTTTKIRDFSEICIQKAKDFGDIRSKIISDYVLKVKELKGE